ncbi:Ribosome biogenesis ATPase rix7 [Entomophthora muscae]|uniref:Ribosome biogenesis ATPase rix7 n=1 Tax=Entomophthora muscae TaxID=34485 RepID=A0ACC2SBI4_9FUNG|nr:Ribosome biogenesis ATPase rix7 [Entomophthora muscae]
MGPPNKKTKVEENPSPSRGPLDRKVEAGILEFKSKTKAKSLADLDLGQLISFIDRIEPSFKRQKGTYKDLLLRDGIKYLQSQETNGQPEEVSADPELEEEDPSLIEDKPTLPNTNSMNKGVTSLWGIPESAADSAKPAEANNKKGRRKEKGADETGSRSQKSTSALTVPTVTLSDLGGIEGCVEEILELIAMPMSHPEIYSHTGIRPPRGVLLHGPPGCGKTLLAHAIAGELKVPFLQISAPSVVSGMSGESEKKLREIFEEARRMAPALLFLDEIDAIAPKRETAQREMERRIVAQLLTCLDDLAWEKNENKPVIVIGATNRPDSLDPALRRAGRFDREISLGVPDEPARERILRVLCTKLRLDGDLDIGLLARRTPGYVGADLSALTSAAGMIAVKRIFSMMKNGDIPLLEPASASPETEPPASTIQKFLKAYPQQLTPEQLEPLTIGFEDFLQALDKVQPSSKREGFATVPDVSWEDIGALSTVRDELRMAVVEPMVHPELFKQAGVAAPAGVLLWGPPGCGKTLLAKAVAGEANSNFISVKGPELLNKYVGESERAIRQVFQRARASQPCVVFFDELDALCSRRDENQSEVSARVVNTLLTELDGMESRKQVFIIAATNRPDIIDPAMLRPGRLDKMLYVELPTADERLEILRAVSRHSPLCSDVDLEKVANDARCQAFSGADLSSLVREAAVTALRQRLRSQSSSESSSTKEALQISMAHFDVALSKTTPSVSPSDLALFEKLKIKFGRS